VCILARRWPVRRGRCLWALGAHAVAAPLLSLIQLTLFALVTVAVRAALYEQDPRLGLGEIVLAALADSFRGKFRSGVLVALIASAAVQARDARRAARASELRSETYRQRLRSALGRVRRVRKPVREASPALPVAEDRVVVAAGGRVAALRFAEIDWIEAAGNYLEFHAQGKTHLGRGTLEGILERAAAHGFVRVHRSRLVRADSVSSVEPAGSGDLLLHLRDGTRLRASRRHRSHVLQAIGARAARPVDGAVRPTARDRLTGPA
jgi:DNA-binding LytR/AlgR family response regulator